MLSPLALFVIIIIGFCGAWMFSASTRQRKLPSLSGETEDEPGDFAWLFAKVKGWSGFSTATKAKPGEKSQVGAVKLFSVKALMVGVVLGCAAGWVTKWPVMGALVFLAVSAAPLLSTKNSARHRNVILAEAVANLADGIVSLVAQGGTIIKATQAALKSPTLEFAEAAEKVRRKMEVSFTTGLEELRVQLPHPLSDVLCSTLHFVATSEATGRASEALSGVSRAAADNARMERRIVIEQRRGYTTARSTMFISLAIMIFQGVTGQRTFSIYDSLQGQIMLAVFGILIAFGVWLTIMVTKGRSMLRLTFPLRGTRT